MQRHPAPGQQETIEFLLDASGRRKTEVGIRRTLVQQGTQRQPLPGPLKEMVRRHDERALDLYLLFRAIDSSEPWDVTRDARVWGRTLGLGAEADHGVSAVSKTWARLDTQYNLVERDRRGRLAKITALDEGGVVVNVEGDRLPYEYPTAGYFKLPFAYWTAPQRWYRSLSFAAKATLLIALSLKPPFVLPSERAPDWYGMSADTMDRGQRELRHLNVLTRTFKVVDNWGSPTGKTTEYRFRLKEPFARPPARRVPRLRVVGE